MTNLTYSHFNPSIVAEIGILREAPASEWRLVRYSPYITEERIYQDASELCVAMHKQFQADHETGSFEVEIRNRKIYARRV